MAMEIKSNNKLYLDYGMLRWQVKPASSNRSKDTVPMKHFEGVQSVEEHAKIILQQLVNHELTKMGRQNG